MSAWIRSVTGRAYQFFVPIAQRTERARPKRQVAGENPAGDTIFCGRGSTAECGRAKAETTVRFRPPAPFRGRSSSAERSFDMREAERAALSAPTRAFSESPIVNRQ